MSHVVVAMEDVELALEVVGALEDAGHVVEHVFDPAEALLRARLLAIDLVVIDFAMRGLDHGLLRRWSETEAVPLVVLSASRAGERLARQLGAVFCERPQRGATADEHRGAFLDRFVDVVQTALGPTALEAPVRKRSGTQRVPGVVLVVARGDNACEVSCSVVRSQLALACAVAASPREALRELIARSSTLRAVLVDPLVLLEDDGGAELHAALRASRLPIVLLKAGSDDDAVIAGRAAWDALPHLRAALASARANH